uniref:cytochrome b n=1 Tax=Micrarionta opuntia TaxID=2914219 RepID=UPI001EF9DAD3|nr:cytochrome b [Micrarionta opuntia]UKG20826.1 cytochrome b [Micrarionta opuntia]
MKKIRLAETLLSLPTPLNISAWWNIGSVLGCMLAFQLMTGIFLSLHYTADLVCTFDSIVHIMRDVPYGWLFRSLHANGASMFFILMYFHIGRGMYYQSFILQPRTWLVGSSIFLISMGTAFLGYVLPWGQMSYWGATVITNLVSAIPYFGDFLVTWIWGGFSVGQPTLNRFYSFHFLLPFALAGMALLHLVFLHEKGSSNPLGNLAHSSKVVFHPYSTWKDVVGISLMFFFLLGIVLFAPNILTDPENFIEANPMVTPTHIQPEWYFLFAYAILRSIPSKLGGVLALGAAVVYLYFFSFASYISSYSVTPFNPFAQIIFWCFVVVFLLLTWLGACPVEDPYVAVAQPMTVLYFLLPVFYLWNNVMWGRMLNNF